MERMWLKIMLWYAILTYTGKEERLTEMIRRMVPGECFVECFVPYFERLRRWHQQNQIHILRLFPGYVFISTDHIEEVFRHLKRVPAMSKILTLDAFEFTPLYDGEAEFLRGILDADHIVRLTYAATDGKGRVTYLAGPLEKCGGLVQAYKFRDRYAQVRLTIAGQEKTVRVGIILNDDIRRETAYGKVEALIAAPEKYTVPRRESGENSVRNCREGERVAVIGGPFEGNVAVIRHVKGDTAKITVHLFDRDIPVEVPVGDIGKILDVG